MERAVAAAADVVGAAPVHELEARRGRHEHVAGVRALERRPEAAERVGIRRRSRRGRRRPPARAPRARPRTVHDRPRPSVSSSPGREAELPARRAHDGLAVLARDHQVHAVELRRAPRSPAAPAPRGRSRRARRPSPSGRTGRPRSRPRSAPGRPGRSTRQRREGVGEVEPLLDLRLRVVRHHDHGVLLEEGVHPAGHVHDPLERPVGLGDRAHLARRGRPCASGCRCRGARRAGSRTGRARQGRRPRSPCGGRAGRAGRARRCSPCCGSRTGRRRRARARRRPRGGTAAPRRCAGRRSRRRARVASGRGRSGRWCRPS